MALNIETRNAQMKALKKQGKTLREIGEKFGVTGTAVWRIVTGYKAGAKKKSPAAASKKKGSKQPTSKKTSPKQPAKTAAAKTAKPLGITKKQQTTNVASKKDAQAAAAGDKSAAA